MKNGSCSLKVLKVLKVLKTYQENSGNWPLICVCDGEEVGGSTVCHALGWCPSLCSPCIREKRCPLVLCNAKFTTKAPVTKGRCTEKSVLLYHNT